MIERSSRGLLVAAALVALCIGVAPAYAQITTGTIVGTVKDSSGAIVPGATVVLISETQGTKSLPATTNATGDYVFPNVTGDTYTVEVTLTGFRTVQQTHVRLSGADRVTVPTLTLAPGGATETVTVTAEAPLIQASSGERSFAVSPLQIQNLPINHGNFTSVVSLTPGVLSGGASAGGTRLGSVGQNNIMMDGASAMDTGNNGQMLAMNVESIAEVKVLTQGYQAEYGRSSGLQISAITKSGTNRVQGSVYSIRSDSDWDTNTWVNQKNGDPKPKRSANIYGYSVGGPIGKPGGTNKLFFFYSHEYRPTNNAINNGNPIRLRVPTLAERNGDFSQTRDNNGALFNLIKDHTTGLPCTSSNTSGCFKDGGVLGKIPAGRLYTTGLALLNRYPLPNIEQAVGTNYNSEIAPPQVKNLLQQPALRLDYQVTPKLRVMWKYQGQRARRIVTPGQIPGFTDVKTPNPFISNYATTVNYTLTPTTFLEGTYGFIRNELTGGNEGGVLVNEASNRLTAMPNFPVLYSDAGLVDSRYYGYEQMNEVRPPWWDGTSINLPPIFSWGNRIGAAPPNQRYPGWWNINRTQDVAVSLTKLAGGHTYKVGFYNNHSFKAQNVGAGGGASFQGSVNFGNDTNNPLDAGFGYANAALGIFSQYLQASRFIEGNMFYDNTEFYLQDNWRVNGRLTLDFGVRFTHQGPQQDKFGQMSNFFPNLWDPSAAQLLYVAGCSNGAKTCSGNTRNAMDPRTGKVVAPPAGVANTQVLIGTPIPGVGNSQNGIRRAGDGIAEASYTWPKIVVGPRVGFAYDMSGSQNMVVRGGFGLFYDRPDGNTVFSIPGNPPIATARDLRYGSLATLGTGLSPEPVPPMIVFQYDAKVPASLQWNIGIQRSLPWASSIDISYVGGHGYDRLGSFQGGQRVDLNAIDIGAAYLPENQDPTLTSTVPGQAAYTTNLLRPYRGLGNVGQNTTDFWDESHSIQTSFQRRFQNGLSAGVNYTLGLVFKGNTGLQTRLQHNPDGSISVRADQAEYEKLNEQLDLRRHVLKANAVWDLPDLAANGGISRAVGHALNDWQITGIWTANSGSHYSLGYSFQNAGASVNMTGSPDYGAAIVYVGDPGSGCTDDQFKQFNTRAVTAPSYYSTGLESGRNRLIGCPDNIVDLSLSRNIRLPGNRTISIRLDAFNAFNMVNYTGRATTIQYNSPTDLTIRNATFGADGSVLSNRSTPRNAGFGAATGAAGMRSVQLYVRFSF